MSNPLTFQILEDIARDLSADEITFPTFLDITFQVRSALKDPNLNVDKLTMLIGAEPMMSAKIIRLANSFVMNPSGQRILDVKTSILRIGLEAVKTISFAVAMEQLMRSRQMQVFADLSRRLWEHSAQVAAVARVLVSGKARGIASRDEAMFAGLVHDMGVFYLMSRASNFPELVSDKVALNELFVGWHDNIGHAVLSAMHLPEAVLEAVLEHETERELPAGQFVNLSDVVYIANRIANLSVSWRDEEYAFDSEALRSELETIFTPEELDEIIERSNEEVSSLKSALGG